MAQQPEAVKAEKKSIGGELVIPIAALLFTFYYFYTIIDTPWTAQVSAFFVGTILIILVAIFSSVVDRQWSRRSARWRRWAS